MVNSTSPLLYYLIITVLYFIFKFNEVSKIAEKNNSSMYLLIYFLFILVGEYFINISITSQLCGSAQYSTAFIATFMPWIFIFGLLFIVLQSFPGWLSPFSNTFGYFVAKLAGIGTLLDNILETDISKKQITGDTKVITEAIEKIYTDKSMFINEITPENFTNMWNLVSKTLFKNSVSNADKAELYKFVILKDNVSEFIWYMLTGILVTSVSYNYMVTNGCQLSVDDMTQRHKDMINQENKTAVAKADSNQRIYSSTE